MSASLRALLDVLLFEWLDVEALSTRPRFAEQGRSEWAAMLDAAERIARGVCAPANRACDEQEPRLDAAGRVQLPASTAKALQAYTQSGLSAATQDAEWGGLQLPCAVAMAANAFVSKASVGVAGYALLSTGNANLILAHGNEAQCEVFARPLLAGRWFGTMCLSEPAVGSSLGDLTTRARPDGVDFESDPLGPRYRLRGSKMWISGADHELAENIVHLVLAKVPLADGSLPEGSAALSLFIVPKLRVAADGNVLALRNGVVLAGLNHKLGWRGTVNGLLNFGEDDDCLGYRIGAEGQGLACMFHMMNEARIGVGLGAAMLAMAGFETSMAYARERRQGRAIGQRSGAMVALTEHADVRRMLLAQKAVAEGALALCLYCARLVDEGEDELLALLTPIAKSWPSQWGLEANSLAIQVLGGAGYTRDWPVEQYWRDQRLNMIHEGTHGIQALDLLLRKASRPQALAALAARINATVEAALQRPELAAQANQLAAALALVGRATKAAWSAGDPGQAALHATPYLQAFGHLVLAWIWLDLARVDGDAGRAAARDYFYAYELPLVNAWLQPVLAGALLLRDLDPETL
ncbi:butyryl-CoA dehydrogenase [Inhella inkyongensis]|uniref:Butyryl-CoA dehydrogenase n=1 Tax=Inhella inkyongensis TaxID=392593 RepID=A0A840S0B6_9BURK|nr:acyl-CoA dehydrogenase [Inhella inkyongensis]MBB5203695.1 butyryl-CoA dehydrogenase [Inhella inkyongensis]